MKPSMRKKARYRALQALYQILIGEDQEADVITQYLEELNPKKVDIEYFKGLIHGVMVNKDELDAVFMPFTDLEIKELTPIELCVLRMAAYEMVYRVEIPYPIIIDEALELTKSFGTQDGFKFVNGVLDKAAKKHRPLDVKR